MAFFLFFNHQHANNTIIVNVASIFVHIFLVMLTWYMLDHKPIHKIWYNKTCESLIFKENWVKKNILISTGVSSYVFDT